MLAAIIQNLQNGPQPQPRPPQRMEFDMGGGGPLGPRYEIVDYMSAIGSFAEVAGEHPVARAARRTRHIADSLPLAKQARESDQRLAAAAFTWGATLEQMRAADEHTTVMGELAAAQARANFAEAMVTEIQHANRALTDELAAQQRRRGGSLGLLLLIGLGVVGVIAIAKKVKARRTSSPSLHDKVAALKKRAKART